MGFIGFSPGLCALETFVGPVWPKKISGLFGGITLWILDGFPGFRLRQAGCVMTALTNA